jgi:putative LysE/RhtB family amino acid efflux pump
MTIMSFAAVFAGLGIAAAPSYFAAATLVAGVFAGSALWWLLVSSVAGQARRHISHARLDTISRCCGLVIAAFGCYAIADAVGATANREYLGAGNY